MDAITSKALREFTTGPLNQLIVNLGGQDGSQWENELKRFLRKEPCWSNNKVAQVPPNLLEFVLTVVIPATTSKFVAKDKFVINSKRNAPVNIIFGKNFTKWFLSGKGKTEEPISEHALCYAKLRKSSTDGPIIAELGGKEKSETRLSDIFSLMEKRNGEDGALLSNGCPNIFYIKDIAGVLRAVYVLWRGDGWYVNADSVGDRDPSRWNEGSQVFSRNSVL